MSCCVRSEGSRGVSKPIESGATAIEYALIAAGIGATIAATVWNMGTHDQDGRVGQDRRQRCDASRRSVIPVPLTA